MSPCRSVLVVDDEPDVVRGLSRILKLDGYHIETASDLRGLFDRENWCEFFAIILDRQLPDGRSDDALPRLRELAPKASVIIVTGLSDREGVLVALRQGAEDYLTKPVNPDELRAVLYRVSKLKEAESARRELEEEIVVAADEERRRIAQDLHDGLGSHLTGLSALSKALATRLGSGGFPGAEIADRIYDLAVEAIDQTRSVARGLYPVKGAKNGLMDSLGELASRTTSDSQVSCNFDCPDPVPLGDRSMANHLYFIAQEAVANALKHADAGEILIELARGRGGLRLRIKDDGCGFADDATGDQQGIGLRTMSYRARLLGGSLETSDAGSSGAEIVCRCPAPIEIASETK